MRQGDSVRDSAELGSLGHLDQQFSRILQLFLQFEMKAFVKAGCPKQSRAALSEAGMLLPEAHRLEKQRQCDFGSHCLSGSEGSVTQAQA